MTDFSTEFIAQQRALADAATARPWEWEAEDASLVSLTSMPDTKDTVLFCERCESCQKNDLHCGWPSNENAAYIVSACNHYPDALAEIEQQTTRAEAAERERDALRDRLHWIPVEERLPEDNEYVLGADRCWKWHSYAVWLYHHALRDRFVHEFSHWIPLPKPPEDGDG